VTAPATARRFKVGIDVGGYLVDRDEEGELTGAQRVEDLAVVVTGPDVTAVGDDPQIREVVAGIAHRAERAADADRRKTCVEQRSHDTQRDEIAKAVGAVGVARLDESRSRPVAELRDRAVGNSGRLGRGETHRSGLRDRRGGSARATGARGHRTCLADPPVPAGHR